MSAANTVNREPFGFCELEHAFRRYTDRARCVIWTIQFRIFLVRRRGESICTRGPLASHNTYENGTHADHNAQGKVAHPVPPPKFLAPGVTQRWSARHSRFASMHSRLIDVCSP